jgi:hypothetical protein
MLTHCVIHRESLTTNELYAELSKVLDIETKTRKYTRTRPLEIRLFAELCEETGAEYQFLLFYCNSRWLSAGKVVARVYNLREVALFLDDENVVYATTLSQ